jgi:hypothetical protein
MCRGFDGSSWLHGTEPRPKRGAFPVRTRSARLARLVQRSWIMLALYLPLFTNEARAEDRVLLSEVLPQLDGTPLGAVDVAPAPAPGSNLTLSRADVLRALTQAGMAKSLKPAEIPKSTRISREAVALSRDELLKQAHDAVSIATQPCELRDVRYPSEVRVSAGPREYRGEFNSLRSGSVTGAVIVSSGGRLTRVPAIATLSCPPPEVSSGSQVTAVAVVGNVKASAPAEAKQPGRVGDIIRITNRATGASLRGRIIDSHTVEVLP